jgi:ribosomal protein L10
MHFDRKKMLAVTKPVYPEQPKICQKYLEDAPPMLSLEGKPYHQFLARELRKDVENCPMLAIFHENSFTMHDLIKINGLLFDMKFEMRIQYTLNTYIAKHALTGTKYEPVLRLIQRHTTLGFCKSTDIPKLLKAAKKMPQFFLLGVVVENRLLHRDDVDKIAKLPNIDLLRGHLCATLNLAGQSLVHSLQNSQISLSNSLSSHSSSLESADTKSS